MTNPYNRLIATNPKLEEKIKKTSLSFSPKTKDFLKEQEHYKMSILLTLVKIVGIEELKKIERKNLIRNNEQSNELIELTRLCISSNFQIHIAKGQFTGKSSLIKKEIENEIDQTLKNDSFKLDEYSINTTEVKALKSFYKKILEVDPNTKKDELPSFSKHLSLLSLSTDENAAWEKVFLICTDHGLDECRELIEIPFRTLANSLCNTREKIASLISLQHYQEASIEEIFVNLYKAHGFTSLSDKLNNLKIILEEKENCVLSLINSYRDTLRGDIITQKKIEATYGINYIPTREGSNYFNIKISKLIQGKEINFNRVGFRTVALIYVILYLDIKRASEKSTNSKFLTNEIKFTTSLLFPNFKQNEEYPSTYYRKLNKSKHEEMKSIFAYKEGEFWLNKTPHLPPK